MKIENDRPAAERSQRWRGDSWSPSRRPGGTRGRRRGQVRGRIRRAHGERRLRRDCRRLAGGGRSLRSLATAVGVAARDVVATRLLDAVGEYPLAPHRQRGRCVPAVGSRRCSSWRHRRRSSRPRTGVGTPASPRRSPGRAVRNERAVGRRTLRGHPEVAAGDVGVDRSLCVDEFQLGLAQQTRHVPHHAGIGDDELDQPSSIILAIAWSG